ncbi:hypothetical protein M422DRAFT_243823 [Sphaerobolus stellatus SS14]|nr:hypothetical protein M422DRAFT_243823 [Sphaerobolus stellatus SS14]
MPTKVSEVCNCSGDQERGYGLQEKMVKMKGSFEGHLRICYLLNNPHAYAKVRAEVDNVLKGEPIHPEHLESFHILPVPVLQETLRFTPSIPVFRLEVIEDKIVTSEGKQYLIPEDVCILVFVTQLHKDTSVWGEDVDVFRPERMLDGGFERAPPWGNGARACIGRPLAWQESLVALASIIQIFDLVHNDPSYQLSYKFTLTVKPWDLHIRAIPRPGVPSVFSYSGSRTTVQSPTSSDKPNKNDTAENPEHGVDLYLAYESNSGTCKDFAQRVASETRSKGFIPHIVSLDAIEPAVPTNGPVIIFTASYEGEPADNARRFVESLEAAHPGKYAGVKYAVFGCGHHDWKQIYQKIPMKLTRAHEFFDTLDTWVPKLWKALREAYEDRLHATGDEGAEEKLLIQMMETSRAARPVYRLSIILRICIMSSVIIFLPRNPEENVSRVLSRLNLLPDQNILIKSKTTTTLPIDNPVSVWEVLSGYVEIDQIASRKNIQELIKVTPEDVKPKLADILDHFKENVIDKHLSVLDVLELYPQIDISLSSFLSLLPAMRIRQYSISSSPLWDAARFSLTLSIIDIPNESSGRQNKFLGVASNYLAKVRPGDQVQDLLYAEDDLKEWQELAFLEVKPPFSRKTEDSFGCKYVQDRVLYDKELIYEYFLTGAKANSTLLIILVYLFYTCGSPPVANGLKETLINLIKLRHADWDDERLARRWESIQKERLATDVFA